MPSAAATSRFIDMDDARSALNKRKNATRSFQSTQPLPPRKLPNVTVGDLEPDQLLPFYLELKECLFSIQRPRSDAVKNGRPKNPTNGDSSPQEDTEELVLLAKLELVEKDPLFDGPVAIQTWREKRAILEKEYAASKKKQIELVREKASAPSDVAAAHSLS